MGRFLNVGYAVPAPWKSSDDIAAIRPHRSRLAPCYRALRLRLWGPARHPYRSYPPTSCACYLACLCSVNPYEQMLKAINHKSQELHHNALPYNHLIYQLVDDPFYLIT
jgi:hypothetical protein